MLRCIAALCVASISLVSLAQTWQQPAPGSVAVTLKPGEPGSRLAPRYSPKGEQLKLSASSHSGVAGVDPLEAQVRLGPNKDAAPQTIVVARRAAGEPYSLLYVQDSATGKLTSKPITTKPNTVRGKLWSSFTAVLQVNHTKPGGTASLEPYPVSFWIVVEKESEKPEIIRMSRRGFLHGEVTLGNRPYDVILSDRHNDGVLGTGDWWELRIPSIASAEERTVGDFAWAEGKAWKLELIGTTGRSGRLVPFDPGITEEQDALKRDRLRADRLAPRAARPVTFRKDVDAALKEAAGNQAVCFIKFETDWCVPCKQMAQYVFTARDVADAAQGITCLIVDGDARKDLTEKYNVKAYPTGILLGTDGKEIARYVGYQNVIATTAFFKKAK